MVVLLCFYFCAFIFEGEALFAFGFCLVPISRLSILSAGKRLIPAYRRCCSLWNVWGRRRNRSIISISKLFANFTHRRTHKNIVK